jgi:8-oxo-dGTP pyrophosphatase MutT (NUDIX family)
MIRGAGVIPYCSTTNRYLLNLRSKEVNAPLTWSGWGGEAEAGESLVDCAKREFTEESGYSKEVDLIRCYTYRAYNLVYINYMLIIPKEFEPILSFESEDGKWFSFQEVINLRNKHFGLISLLNSREFYDFIDNFNL